MRKPVFWVVYILFLIVQMIICNYFRLTPYVMLSLLPIMVLCIPIRVGTIPTMLIAFVSALLVDLLSEGLLGLNAMAILPVALLRKDIIRLVFGDEMFSRREDFSLNRSGTGKVSVAILLAQALFLLVYIWIDGAGTRPFWFNAARFAASLVAGYALALLSAGTLAPDSRK